MIAFRGDEYLWWQVAEYTYDTFMIRNRTGATQRLTEARRNPARTLLRTELE